jgi:hypothetical protein
MTAARLPSGSSSSDGSPQASQRDFRALQQPDTGRLPDSGVNLAPKCSGAGRPIWMVGSTRICASGRMPLVKSPPWRPSRAGNWHVRLAGPSSGFQNSSNPLGTRAGAARRDTVSTLRRYQVKTGIISFDGKPDGWLAEIRTQKEKGPAKCFAGPFFLHVFQNEIRTPAVKNRPMSS